MASYSIDGSVIRIDTDALSARIHTEGYVSGVAAGTLVDRATGARDLGFGLDIADFLLEPRADESGVVENPYHCGDPFHGNLVKRYVELPQICTQAKKLQAQVQSGDGWVTVRQSYRYTQATYGRQPGSRWEQTLLFRDGVRYFVSSDRITSANAVDSLIFRLDMPGHLKHEVGDSFEQIYLSYCGCVSASAFLEDFPPDARYLYQRGTHSVPERMIRAYQVSMNGEPGPWLAGMTLNPDDVYEAWCHQRGYVCLIEEIGGRPIVAGGSFGAAYVVGWFDGVDEMHAVYDGHRGASMLTGAGPPELA